MSEKEEREEARSELYAAYQGISAKTPGGMPAVLRQAMPERLHINFSGHVYRQFVYNAPTGLEPLLILAPTFWCPVADILLARDQIRVLDDLGYWEAQLTVQTVDTMRVDVERIYLHAFATRAGPRGGSTIKNVEGAEVRWTGLQDKWAATVGENILRSGFGTSGEAWQWLNGHLRTVEKPT